MNKNFSIEILESIEQIISDYNLEKYDISSSLGKRLEKSTSSNEKVVLKILFDNEIEKTFNLKKNLLPSNIIKKILLEENLGNIKLRLEKELKLQPELAQEIFEKLSNQEHIKNFINQKNNENEKSSRGGGLSQELI